MTVFWTDVAIAHLQAIEDHVGQDSPLYARRLIDCILRRSEQIGLFPQSGRVVPEYRDETIREVIERPYRIMYRIRATQIDVVAVIHSARLAPPEV